MRALRGIRIRYSAQGNVVKYLYFAFDPFLVPPLSGNHL